MGDSTDYQHTSCGCWKPDFFL